MIDFDVMLDSYVTIFCFLIFCKAFMIYLYLFTLIKNNGEVIRKLGNKVFFPCRVCEHILNAYVLELINNMMNV